MAVATLVSRITGFGWKLLLVAIVGINAIQDSFNVANTLPNIIFELLLGGVLASVVVPLLVRSQDDPDGGQEYMNRLLTVGMTGLGIGTVVAIAAAPLFTWLYVDGSTGNASPELTTAFAYLLLPEILFYGLFALLSAILQARHVFGPTAWAPVLNNVVVVATLLLYLVVPGEITVNPVDMSQPKLLVLGIGVTLGIVVQSVVLIPALRRIDFRFRWTWGFDARLKEFGGLALWVLGYVAVSQVGLIVTQRVLTAGEQGGVSIYANAWLLFQLPYGVIGVSLLTAILPRMSKSAARGDTQAVIDDLATGSRLSAVMLVPISGVLTIAGSAIGVALYAFGQSNVVEGERLGTALAFSAFGLLPYALVMLQLRVFYAMKDARTPTVIMIGMTLVKVPLLYMCGAVLSPENVVIGVMLVNSLSYVIGAVAGQMWLWVRLGHLRNKKIVSVIAKTTAATAAGMGAAWLAAKVILPDGVGGIGSAWVSLIVQGLVACAVAFGGQALLKVPELKPAVARITRLVRRG
ncbi:murein biosynthesis integral membrane protein MurJ [Actinokineospora soli]